MPGKPRFNFPDVPQHIIQRGINREPCFVADGDSQPYLDDLAEASRGPYVAKSQGWWCDECPGMDRQILAQIRPDSLQARLIAHSK